MTGAYGAGTAIRQTRAARPAKRPRSRDDPPSLRQEFLFLLLKTAAVIVALTLILTFLYGLHRSADAAMNPAIRDGDLVIFYRPDKTYAAGDVLLLEYQGKRQVRRVVATAGDTVDITGEGLQINNALQQEPEIYQQTERYSEGINFPLTIGEGEVFVLADARENADDSRIYGPVAAKDTLGKAITILRRRHI